MSAPHGRPLVLEGLTKRFEGLVAVDQASFTAPPGRITGLIGPNGAGKSTIVNLLTGQFAPTSGAMRFGEVDLGGVKPHRIASLGLARTFQNIRLFENLTVYESVLVSAYAIGLSRREAAALAYRELEALDLAERARDLAGSLPYGARKRLEIARCLALRPSLILLDEPAAGMNPEETADLARRLEQISHERHIAILLIDHDLEFVNRLSSSIVVVNRGRVIASGTPEEIRYDPAVIEAYIGKGRAGGPPSASPNPQLSEGEVA